LETAKRFAGAKAREAVLAELDLMLKFSRERCC